MTYDAKRAIADLGFIEAYARHACLPGDDLWFESFMDALSRIEAFVRKGYLLGRDSTPQDASGFLYDVGFVRGSIWNDRIPMMVSESLKDVVNFVAGCNEWWGRSEPAEEMLSDAQRDTLTDAAINGRDIFSPDLLEEIGAPPQAVARFSYEELGAFDREEADRHVAESRDAWEAERAKAENAPSASPQVVVSPLVEPKPAPAPRCEPDSGSSPVAAGRISVDRPSGRPVLATEAAPPAVRPAVSTPHNPDSKRGRREWTPEQRAEAADRARRIHKSKPPLVPDGDLEKVRARWESGESFDSIARPYRCSGGHIRNFLKKHGVDPRRSSPGVRNGGRPELTADQSRTFAKERVNGTASKGSGEMVARTDHAADANFGQGEKCVASRYACEIAAFLDKGGKIKKLPPRFAEGVVKTRLDNFEGIGDLYEGMGMPIKKRAGDNSPAH